MIAALAVARVDHDLLEQGEEHLDQLVERAAVLLEVILVGLEDLLEGHQPRDQNGLIGDAQLDAVSYFLY